MLNVNDERIIRLHNVDKLHCMGLMLIKDLYRNRTRGKKIESKNGTSPLFEIQNGNIYIERFRDLTEQTEGIDDIYERAEKIINEALTSEKKLFLKVTVFTKANEEGKNINNIHKKTGISRNYLTKLYKEGQKYIKNKLYD
jgi:hypothetical protein